MTRISLLALAFCAAATAPAQAADNPRTLTVSGMGEARGTPDEASFSTGVVSQGATAAAALAANSRAMNAIFATLKRLGIPDKDIQTSNVSVSPQYQQCRPGVACASRIVGYEVSNTITVLVEDMNKTGPALDALVSSGSNRIDSISFAIRDTTALQKQAREAAVKDAIARANTYAAAAGVTLGPIQSIDEGSRDQPEPMNRLEQVVVTGARVPIAAGQESLSATVTVTWALK